MKRFLPTLLALLLLSLCLPASAQKWTYDFIVPDNGNFASAIAAANNRANKQRRFRIFVRASNYRLGQSKVTLTAPNTSIIGEQRQGTQIETCPQTEGLDAGWTLLLRGADSTYIQDVELWSNYKNDTRLWSNKAVTLREQNCKGNVMKNVFLRGTGNTYYTSGSTAYLEDCKVMGTTDFVCGGGTIYFDHCDITLANRGDGSRQFVVCAPATEQGRNYGFVFNSCYLDGPSHQSRHYLLGRPWQNAPRAAYINCQMNLQPAAEGWAQGVAKPALLGEFESTDAQFQLIDQSQRAPLSTKISAEEAEKYTVAHVFGPWEPQAKSEQVPPPVLHLNGRELSWKDDPEAGCYVVCRDRKIVAFTTQPHYTIPAGTREGSCYTVRCANQMGGLGIHSEKMVYPQR